VFLYHRTASADAILREGFRDDEGSYGFGTITLRGVFLSNVPLDFNEGAKGDDLLAVEVPDDLDLDNFELVQEGAPYREWCVPADLLNTQCAVRLEETEVWPKPPPGFPDDCV